MPVVKWDLKEAILAENEDFIAINKPSGLLSIPDRSGAEKSLKEILAEKYGTIFTVHRIDKETSGLILFAKNTAFHQQISKQFESRQTIKIYQGLVNGTFLENTGNLRYAIKEHPVRKGVMHVDSRGKESITEYSVLQRFTHYTWLQFRILTGRTHQIRVHMKEIGHPLVGDPIYGDGKPLYLSQIKNKFKLSKDTLQESPILGRLALHAFSLGFEDRNHQFQQIEAPLPKDLRATLQQLEKWQKKPG